MKRFLAVELVLLAFALGAGCPLEFGKGGRIDIASGKDLHQESVVCPPGKHLVPPDPACTKQCAPLCVDDNK